MIRKINLVLAKFMICSKMLDTMLMLQQLNPPRGIDPVCQMNIQTRAILMPLYREVKRVSKGTARPPDEEKILLKKTHRTKSLAEKPGAAGV